MHVSNLQTLHFHLHFMLHAKDLNEKTQGEPSFCILDFSFTSRLSLLLKQILLKSFFVCNEGLFWLGESCLNYIISVLHLHVSLRRSAKKKTTHNKTKEKNHFNYNLWLSKHSPLKLYPGLSGSISLRPSVPISPTPPSHITPLITPQREANPKKVECQRPGDWSCCKSVARWPLVHLRRSLCSWKSDKSDKNRDAKSDCIWCFIGVTWGERF